MGAAMNPPSMSEAKSPASRRKGRLQLLLILLGVIGPMILATGMYKLQFWVPEGAAITANSSAMARPAPTLACRLRSNAGKYW